MNHLPKLTKAEAETLLTLCRDDGYTIVADDLTIQTANPQAPNLGRIVDLLQGSEAMLGKSVIIEEVPQSVIDNTLSTFTDEQRK